MVYGTALFGRAIWFASSLPTTGSASPNSVRACLCLPDVRVRGRGPPPPRGPGLSVAPHRPRRSAGAPLGGGDVVPRQERAAIHWAVLSVGPL